MANKLKMRGLIDTYDSATGRGTFQLLSDYRKAFEILHQRVKGESTGALHRSPHGDTSVRLAIFCFSSSVFA